MTNVIGLAVALFVHLIWRHRFYSYIRKRDAIDARYEDFINRK